MTAIDIPPSWHRSARAILERRLRKVLVIGATDSGKSTYCGFLAASLGAAGATVAFVDADIGQKDVGPPATISLARLEPHEALAQAKPSALYLVGDVDPIGHMVPMVVGTRRMVDAAEREFVLIDTLGYIEGAGRALTAYQIESLRPDVVVALQRERELEPTLRASLGHRTFRLRPSRMAARKSGLSRARAREQAFRIYFAEGRDAVLELGRLAVQRARVFIGEPFADPRFLYAERTPEGVVAIGDTAAAPPRGWRVLPRDFADNLLCGVVDEAGECRGLALIEHIDFARAPLHPQLHLFTPVAAAQIRGLQFGDLYLARDGRELGRKRPGLF
jgi:polynucleotide 5'-hydroxyl-kinase GRC3/NOL9